MTNVVLTNVILQFTTDLDSVCMHDHIYDSHFTVRISCSCLCIAPAATTTLLTAATTAFAATTTAFAINKDQKAIDATTWTILFYYFNI